MRSSTDGNGSARHGAMPARGLRTLAAFAGLVVGLLAWSGVAVAAAPGSLDGTFGSGGVVSLGSGVQVFGVAVQSDGGVVAAGQSGGRVLVERLGSGGQLAGSYLGAAGYARAVGVAPDGKIVVAGSSGGAMFVERLTSALVPDSGFGSGGVALAFAGQSGVAYGVAVGSDGSLVAAGSVNPTDTRVGVARFSPAGAVQWSQVLNFGTYSVARGVAVQRDGKIVVVGSQTPSQLTNALIARLTSGGALDSTFAGGHGVFTYSFPGTGYTSLNAVTLQSNGQIVAAGLAAAGPTTLVLRANANGSLDSSFGSGGVSALPAGQNVNVTSFAIGAYGVGIAAGGRIVAAGNYENTGTEVDAALWAFNSGGAAEGTFGSAGTVRGPQGAYEACALAVAPDGSLVTAGNTVTSFPDANPCTVTAGSAGLVARYVGFGPIVTPPPPPPPALKVTLKNLKGSYKRASVSRSGLRFSVGCNEACTIKITLTANAAVAKHLHISKTSRRCRKVNGRTRCVTTHRYVAITVASQQARLSGSGTKTFTIKNSRLRSSIAAFNTVKLSLHIAVTSTATHKRSSINRTLTFRR
jgi:uncharacterized delta-60 repeat protein